MSEGLGNIFTDAWGAVTGAAQSVISTIEDIPSEWNAKVAELKAKATQFMLLFDDLSNLAPVAARDARTKAQYDALMARGASIKAKVQQVTSAIDNVYRMAQNALSGFGMNGVGDLGVIPLIPIAVIVGAIGLIMVWIADALNMRQKLQAAQASGATGEQITRIATGGSGGGITSMFPGGGSGLLGNTGTLLLIGVAILFLAPAIKRAIKP
jgi:hypothetical protein